jgi:hypothetical protein
MTDETKAESDEECAAVESRQREFEHAHDIWASVFSPLRPRRPRRPAAAESKTSDAETGRISEESRMGKRP